MELHLEEKWEVAGITLGRTTQNLELNTVLLKFGDELLQLISTKFGITAAIADLAEEEIDTLLANSSLPQTVLYNNHGILVEIVPDSGTSTPVTGVVQKATIPTPAAPVPTPSVPVETPPTASTSDEPDLPADLQTPDPNTAG